MPIKSLVSLTAGLTVSSMVALVGSLAPAQAVELVRNGGLVPISGTPGSFDLNAQGNNPTNSTTIPNWTVKGSYDWLYADGLNATGGSGSTMWGAGQTVNSPTGSGWFVALDGDQAFPGSIEQTLTGLVNNESYTVSFWQAAAQQNGFYGATTERWQVSLGNAGAVQSSNLMTPTNIIDAQNRTRAANVTPWQQETMTFTYTGVTGGSSVLKFLAFGTPSNATAPPFSLLAGVSVDGPQAVPEPIEVAGTLVGFGTCLLLRSKLKRKK
jgi:hypothetical protein